MNMKFLTVTSAVICGSLVLAGCARNIDPNVYKASHVGETSTTYEGVVQSARQVLVEDQEYLENNDMGMVGGGLLGGVLGSQVGKGWGSVAAGAAGAIAGGAAGAYAEKEAKSQMGWEYIVKLNDGRMMTVVQGGQGIAPGTPVYLMQSYQGRSRITPR